VQDIGYERNYNHKIFENYFRKMKTVDIRRRNYEYKCVENVRVCQMKRIEPN
jgi:hypothetical protein